jgi:hypothetical protein
VPQPIPGVAARARDDRLRPAQTIAVTLTASGLNVGYCTDQRPALFKPKDFTADSHGNINAG